MGEESKFIQLKNQIPHVDSGVVPVAELSAEFEYYKQTYKYNRFQALKTCDYRIGYVSLNEYRIATHVWSTRDSRATVFVSHGLFDHVGLYLQLVEVLVGAGYKVIAIDFPGHGLSDGIPAVIYDFKEYSNVIDRTLGQVSGEIIGELFAVGQSTGCSALMNYFFFNPNHAIARAVFLAPLLRPRGWWGVNLLYILLNRFFKFVPRSFTVNSHDDEFTDFLVNGDPLQTKNISVHWVGAMRRWVKNFSQYSPVETPTLIIQGDDDSTVDWQYNLPRLQDKLPQSDLKMLSGGRHHLVNEGDHWRTKVFDLMLTFLS